MDRIKDTFTRCAAENRKALVAYLTAGYPDRPTSSELIEATVKAGADIIELGVPFSDHGRRPRHSARRNRGAQSRGACGFRQKT